MIVLLICQRKLDSPAFLQNLKCIFYQIYITKVRQLVQLLFVEGNIVFFEQIANKMLMLIGDS